MPENQSDKNAILLKRLEIVKKYRSIKNDFELAKALKISSSYFYEIMNGSKKVPKTTGQKLEDHLNISRKWFETGMGFIYLHLTEADKVMHNVAKNTFLKGEETFSGIDNGGSLFSEPETAYNITEVKNTGVPIYDVEFSAGVMANLIESRNDHFPVGFLSIPEVNGCDAIIRVKGDSMADRINDRDWIGIKRMDINEWFPLGFIYAIETTQAQVIKYIKKGSDADSLKIISHNTFYDEEEIPKSIIKELWSVRAVLPFSKIETFV